MTKQDAIFEAVAAMQFVADQQTETETRRRYNEASLTLLSLLEWDRVTAAAALVTLRGAVRYFCQDSGSDVRCLRAMSRFVDKGGRGVVGL